MTEKLPRLTSENLEKLRRQKRTKYGSRVTVCDGIRFQSKREAETYWSLTLQKKAGGVKFFLRQVPFHLPGGVIYRADFLVVFKNQERPGRDWIEVWDAKGFRTETYKLKKRQVEALYGIKILEV